jgi:hypothetical protein
MKQNKWPDFLLTVAVRFICGFVFGCLAFFVIFWRGILRSFSHDNSSAPLIVMILCGAVGSIIAVFTIPYWQTPWYKGIRDR